MHLIHERMTYYTKIKMTDGQKHFYYRGMLVYIMMTLMKTQNISLLVI